MVIYYLEGRSVDICHGNVDFRRVHFAITADKYIVSYKQTGRREDGETEGWTEGKLVGGRDVWEGRRVGERDGGRWGRGREGRMQIEDDEREGE